jgi:hypothetical protein
MLVGLDRRLSPPRGVWVELIGASSFGDMRRGSEVVERDGGRWRRWWFRSLRRLLLWISMMRLGVAMKRIWGGY